MAADIPVGMQALSDYSNYIKDTISGTAKSNKGFGDFLQIAAKKISDFAEDVGDAGEQAFDIIVFIKEHWKLCIVGVVALLILLRD